MLHIQGKNAYNNSLCNLSTIKIQLFNDFKEGFVEKPVRPLADGHMTITVSHMIYLLMWLTDSCLQIYSIKRQGTSDPKTKWKKGQESSETLLIFMVCTFLCFYYIQKDYDETSRWKHPKPHPNHL